MPISDEILDLQTFNLIIAASKSPQQQLPQPAVKLNISEELDSMHDNQREWKSDILTLLCDNSNDDFSFPRVYDQISAQEQQAIKLALNSQDIDDAAEILEKIIALDPRYASAYNNLAQVYRIKLEVKDDIIEKFLLYEKIVVCLKNCLSLCEPTLVDNGEECRTMSSCQKTLLRQCYTQLSLVHLQMSHEKKLLQLAITADSTNSLATLIADPWSLDSAIYTYLERAGLYGNVFAEFLAPYKNPYAQVCGQIVREALAHNGI